MAKLEYDKNGRLLFTKEMREEYTIFIPMMLPVHMTLLERVLNQAGYHCKLLTSTHSGIVNEGLQNVHNDTCYPALLVIGQMLDAIKNGGYDPHKVALMITQTGGGCRASNYIHLLRKALKNNGMDYIPVISFNLTGMEHNPGFRLNFSLATSMITAVIYADLLMNLGNQLRPYEKNEGETDALIMAWNDKLLQTSMSIFHIKKTMAAICEDFNQIETVQRDKTLVGIVGEIYIKYSPLGNNNLEEFLRREGCEVVIPGLLDFIIFMSDHHIVDSRNFGIKYGKGMLSYLMKRFFIHVQKQMIRAVKRYPRFRPPAYFEDTKKLAGEYLNEGNKMGEGWLLTGEMLELIHSGVKNIVCAQPFGCLPNHIVGKGMIRAIRERNPQANIVAIDYDPGATKINQENRIKLMLSIAREEQKSAAEKTAKKMPVKA